MGLITSDRIARSARLPTAPPLHVLLASPRGFCAGVVRAIEAVENALAAYGPPVYVRRAIVHNLSVVRALERQGAVFIAELGQAPRGAPVILSAHGVSSDVIEEGRRLGLRLIDAVCPLVSKVHREVRRHAAARRHVVLIGHEGHPEILGTMGQLPKGATSLVSTVSDIAALALPQELPVAYAVQTTFSVEEANLLVDALAARFSNLAGPSSSDICYATTNRQRAVRAIAPRVDAMIVVGEDISSNANRLVDVARASGCPAQLVACASAIDWDQIEGLEALGVTSAASTPETSVRAVIDALATRFSLRLERVGEIDESTSFRPVQV